jgi:hypothetical protein
MTIWKYTLKAIDIQTLFIPSGAKLLTVQMQHDCPQLWVLCEPLRKPTPRRIAIYGTGNPVPHDAGEYISTFQMNGGALVFHAFEIKC